MSQRDITVRIVPLSELFVELARFVDDDLAVIGLADGLAFEGPWGGAFEVDAGDFEAAAVAGAFEFLLASSQFGVQPRCVQVVLRA